MTYTNDLPKYLSAAEMACPTTGTIKIDKRFADAWVELREEWALPLKVNSGCRTPKHNEKIGGHPRSLHLTENPVWPTYGTMAVDIQWRDWATGKQQQFAELARSKGWRVGLANGFIHIDRGHDVGVKTGVYFYKGYIGGVSVK